MLAVRTYFAAALIAAALGGLAVAQSQETPPQAPQVKIEQNSDSAAKTNTDSHHDAQSTKQEVPVDHHNSAIDTKRQTDQEAEKRAEEASEYGIFFGRRLKITDFLLALFTFFLVVVGFGQGIFLYRTDQGTHKAANAAKESADALVIVERPYIFMTTPKIVNGPNNGYILEYALTNYGRTPAILRFYIG